MHIMFFTERAYHGLPEDEVFKLRSFFGVPNKFFDAQKGAAQLNMYIDEKIYCDELGFDGVMLNEHHGTPFCMGAVMDVEAAVLAKTTKNVKIVLLGNPIPTVANPLRLAEELAMIDMISGGRLVPGWVRGAGSEQLANNANPAYNREYFDEAHDFILDAWTKPGPWRYEGKHFHYRFVNPWVLPVQKPHPPIWIPGLISPETVVWTAGHKYPYVALATMLEPTLELFNMYGKLAADQGYQAGPENFGYLQPVFCADTDEKAYELGKGFMFGGGFSHFARPEWMFPPGYNSKAATRRLAAQHANPNLFRGTLNPDADPTSDAEVQALKKAMYAGYPDWQKQRQVITGSPETLIKKLRYILEVLRPGIFSFWLDGPYDPKDRRRCVELLGKEVMPALRQIAKELELTSPFEVKPGSRPLSGGYRPVGDASRLEASA
ncbi:MAG TPA: LLM class flavin-dependent oxidoreductase [Candidatus Binataceae bacterium]|nr:LLM class flavin-dependent oxidoreductase [Candidatus Binataceae bacterium]